MHPKRQIAVATERASVRCRTFAPGRVGFQVTGDRKNTRDQWRNDDFDTSYEVFKRIFSETLIEARLRVLAVSPHVVRDKGAVHWVVNERGLIVDAQKSLSTCSSSSYEATLRPDWMVAGGGCPLIVVCLGAGQQAFFRTAPTPGKKAQKL